MMRRSFSSRRSLSTLSTMFGRNWRKKLLAKDAFIIDMDGVIYHGDHILPGVPRFIEWLNLNSKRQIFVIYILLDLIGFFAVFCFLPMQVPNLHYSYKKNLLKWGSMLRSIIFLRGKMD